MSAPPLGSLPHPLLGGVAALEDALDHMPTSGWANLEPQVLRPSADRLMRIEGRLKAQLLAVARALDASGAAKAAGATSTGAMLAKSFGGDRRAADSMVHQGKALKAAPATEAALAAGQIGDAERLSLKDLRTRSLRITDQFKSGPEVDNDENETLEKKEKRAWKSAEFWMVNDGNGTCRGGFKVPEAQGEMLLAAVRAISAPKRDHLRQHPGSNPGANGDPLAGKAEESVYERDLDYRTRLGMGFAELCGHLPTDKLPSQGGLGATLVVRFDYETLLEGIKAATLSTGTRISAGQARLMACNLGIIPQVFNGKSLPLDHGRAQRLFDAAQKLAMAARDGGCTFPGCDRPPEECEGHHWRRPWAAGATTNLDDGTLVCPAHHRIIHIDGWEIAMNPATGHIEYRAPGALDWQRNHRWRP